MKIYMPHSRGFDFKKEWYAPVRASALNSQHEIVFPHETVEDFDSKQSIKAADIIVAEVSFPSTGVGIELGWANMLGKNIICANKIGTTTSSSLSFVCSDTIEYSDSADLLRQLAAKIS